MKKKRSLVWTVKSAEGRSSGARIKGAAQSAKDMAKLVKEKFKNGN